MALAGSPTCFSLPYSAILEAVREVVDVVPVAEMSWLARVLTFAAESRQRVEREESDFESASMPVLAGSRPTVSSFRPSSPAVDQEEGHIALREHRGKELVLVELCSSDVQRFQRLQWLQQLLLSDEDLTAV